MTDDRAIRTALDDMGVPWDDPLRARAIEFAKRTPDEQNLWLFVEMSRLKPSRTPTVLNAAYTSVVAFLLAATQVLAGGQK